MNINNKKLFLVVIIIGLIIIIGYTLLQNKGKLNNLGRENIIATKPAKVKTETDTINTFFKLISGQKPAGAVDLMNPKIAGDSTLKQTWVKRFSVLKKIEVKNIEPSNQSSWSENQRTYKTTLFVELNPEAAANAPIPNYGWENGQNIRWLMLSKENNQWFIDGIITSP